MNDLGDARIGSVNKSPRWLSRGVLGIGLASLFSDWGHEAATSVLPGFLASLGAPPVALGVIEGVSDGLSSFAKLAGGFLADHPRLRKPLGVAGYFATAITTFAYAFARSWPGILILRALGWIGRGSRGPSRDALLADCVSPGEEGRAFGFERAMDTLGAVLGPLCAAALMGSIGARGVMKWTLLPGSLAAVVFALLAPRSRSEDTPQHAASLPFAQRLSQLPATYKYFLAGVFAHGIGDFAPTLLILRAAQILTPQLGKERAAAAAVGLYTFYNVVNAAATYPAGALSDRLEKRSLLALGYLVGAFSFAGFIAARQPSLFVLAFLFGLAGVHGAFQQSIEKSAAAEFLPAPIRGTGFGVLAATNGVGDMVSSVVVGVLWSSVSATAGFLYAAIFSALGAAMIYFVRGQPERNGS
jgi:MFS family permease